MTPLSQELILGVASNGLWSLISKASGAGLQSLKELLSKKTATDDALQAALRTIAETYPLGSGTEKVRLTTFIQSPEVESVVRQLYASDISGSESTTVDSIRKEFITLFSLHLDVSPAAIAKPADALFDAIVLGCNQRLAAATQCGVLEPHESLSSVRHRRIMDELSTIERNLAVLDKSSQPDIASFMEFESKYRNQVGTRHGTIQPPHFDSGRKVPLDDLYVAPRFSTIPRNKQSEPQLLNLRPLLANVHRTVVIGNPGGGKSTLASKVLHDLAAQYDQRIACGRTLTPVVVVLREYGRLKKDDKCSIVQFIELQANSNYQVPAPDGAFEYLLLNGRLLVIFDGLDELLDTAYRQEVSADVESFCNLYPTAPVLVTSREVGYDQAPLDEQRFSLFRIVPFDEEQIKDYATKWFSRDEDYTVSQRHHKAKAFLEESQLATDLRSNPLMLGLMCNLYRVEGYIPRNRADVYEKCSVMLFERWDKGRGILVQLPFEEHIRPAMQHLAFWIYSDESLQGGVTRGNLIARTSAYLQQWVFDDSEKARGAASKFIDFCTGRAWVFTDTGTTAEGENLFQFTHRTFLEYFTASYLSSLHPTPDKLADVLRPRIRKEEWDVVALLAFQVQGRRVQGAADELLLDLVLTAGRSNNAEALASLSFAGRCLEAVVPSPATRRAISVAALDFCILGRPELFSSQTDVSFQQRAPANQLLGPLLVANLENRTTIADAFQERLIDVISHGTETQAVRALEIVFHPNIAFDPLHRSPGSEVIGYWRGVMKVVLDKVGDRIREFAKRDLSTCVDAVMGQFVKIEDLLLWHGIEGLFTDMSIRTFSAGRINCAWVLLRQLMLYETNDESFPGTAQVPARIATLGELLLKSATPWVKVISPHGIRHLFDPARRPAPKFRSSVRVAADVLFGALCLLLVLVERAPDRVLIRRTAALRGFGKRLMPIVIGRARPSWGFRGKAKRIPG